MTAGRLPAVYSDIGAYGPIESILFPIHHGILSFAGIAVIEPFVVYGPARLGDDERRAHLARYRQRILGLRTAPTLPGLTTGDYDGLVRRSTAPVAARG